MISVELLEKSCLPFFLMETKTSSVILESVRIRLGFHDCLTVNPVGRSGGLAMLWKEESSLEVVNFSNQHIHTRVRELGCERNLFITGFYGSPITCRRVFSWSFLSSLNHSTYPWCVVGDFNKIVVQDEKLGERLRPQK